MIWEIMIVARLPEGPDERLKSEFLADDLSALNSTVPVVPE